MGSPVTHKNYWELYTPIKKIIKEFPYTDEGWLEALEYEGILIKPVYNIDPLCLNEHCGGRLSLDARKSGGKIAGQKSYELGLGIHSLTDEERIENGKKGAQKAKELCVGLYALTKEKRIENSKKAYEVGLANLSKEERSELGKATTSQVWECTITKYRSNPGGLSTYQKSRNIDTSNRIRIK